MNSETHFQFYDTSIGAYDALFEGIQGATSSICLEFFIFLADISGNRFFDLLIEKAKSGVDVRIIFDTVGSFPLLRSVKLAELEASGAKVHFFNQIIPWHPNKESFWYFRDHSKLAIIDNKIAFTGGLCIGDEYSSWRDSFVKIQGPVVSQMLRMFDFMWNKEYKNPDFIFSKKRSANLSFLSEFDYLMNIPLPRKRFLYYALTKALTKAKKEILITNPYFAPDHKILRLIHEALKRGVKVVLLVPENPNHKLIAIAMRSYFADLLHRGAKIFFYKKMIHAKTAVIDEWSTIGSLNLDNISLRYNFEGNIVSTHPAFREGIARQFYIDLEHSSEIILPHWQRRGIWKKIQEFIVWPIRKLL